MSTKKHAEGLLVELKGSGNHEETKQLQTAYQRLWDRNEYESHSEIRRNIYRFVLCWREPLSVDILTKAMQINNEGEGADDETLPEQRIRDLGADFLTFDKYGKINFTHDSANAFVSQLLDDVDGDSTLFRQQETHRHVLRLFIQVFAPTTQSSPYVFGLARYFSTYLSYHCQQSIQDALIYNKEWEILFDQVLDSYSRIVPSAPGYYFRRSIHNMSNRAANVDRTQNPMMVRRLHRSTEQEVSIRDVNEKRGRLLRVVRRIQPSTIQVPYDIKMVSTALGYPWTRNISDETFKSLRNAREDWGEQARYLERRLEGILSGRNLSLAVRKRDISAASFMLHGSWSSQGPEGVLDLIEDTVTQALLFYLFKWPWTDDLRTLFERFIDRCAHHLDSTARSAALRRQFLSGMAEGKEGGKGSTNMRIEKGRLYVCKPQRDIH